MCVYVCKYKWCESRAGRNIQERKKHREEEKKRVDEGKKGNKGDNLVIKGTITHVCENIIIKIIILYAT